jgi:hypothetical protein
MNSKLCKCNTNSCLVLESYHKYPKISLDEIQLLWYDSYYDGPLSGILRYKNQIFAFQNCDDFENYQDMVHRWIDGFDIDWARRFIIYEISHEEAEDELFWYGFFREYFGTHRDYFTTEKGKGSRVTDNALQMCKIYQELAAKKQVYNFHDLNIIGWFER